MLIEGHELDPSLQTI